MEIPHEQTTIKNIKSFPTIDQCVIHLQKLGIDWTHEKEKELRKNAVYVSDNTLVFYDPLGLLDNKKLSKTESR